MGAWGLKLFQSDYDYDIIADLDSEVGLRKLEDEANKAAAKNGKKPTKTEDGEDDDRGVHYSIFADHCSTLEAVEVVRKLMDGGKLAQLVAKYESKMAGVCDDWHPPVYVLVIIGACAMTLGCTLAPSFIDLLKGKYATAGIMRDAKTQMHKALYGPNGYTNGTLYDFGSLGLMETMNSGGPADEDTMYPESIYGKKAPGSVKMMNCPSPGGLPPLPPDVMADLRRKMRGDGDAPMQQKEFADDVCGGCGKKEGEGGKELTRCGKCKGRKYCGKVCQKKHWKKHKGVCKVPADETGARKG